MRTPTQPICMARVVAGKYRVGRMLGEGGMGAVYAAEHTELGTTVAVKMMSDHCMAAPEALVRFKREAHALAAVRHENVVSVMDAGTDDGVPFLVMELLDGESLEALMRRQRRLPPQAAVWITTEILSGLGATHAKGIVHRDLKPGNVFLARQADGTVRAKLLDFGVSKLVDGNNMTVTRDGAAVGTPLFMAPEQLRGEAVDRRSDLYSAGVVLYRMLTGRWPWAVTKPEEIYDAVLAGDVRPLSEAVPDIPPALEYAVLRALDRDPDRRYANASLMRSALLSCLPSAQHGSDSIPLMGAPATPPPMRHDELAAGTPHTHTTAAATRNLRDPSDLNDPRRAISIIKPAKLSIPSLPHPQRKLRRALGFVAGGLAVAVLTLTVLLWRGNAGNAAASAAKTADANASGPAYQGAPLKLGMIRYLPTKEVIARHQPLADHLSKRLHRRVDVVVVEDYEELAAKVVKGDIQIAAMSPYSYVRAKQAHPKLQLLATPVAPGGAASYEGYILTRADSGIANLGELHGKTFCYVREGSTSGYLYPRHILRKAGIDPDAAFKATRFGGDHLTTLKLLHRGKCDGAAVYAGAWFDGAKHGMAPQGFRMLATTGRLPYDAYVAAPSASTKLADAVAAALLELQPHKKTTKRILGDALSTQFIGFVRARERDYDPVRDLAKIKRLGKPNGGIQVKATAVPN